MPCPGWPVLGVGRDGVRKPVSWNIYVDQYNVYCLMVQEALCKLFSFTTLESAFIRWRKRCESSGSEWIRQVPGVLLVPAFPPSDGHLSQQPACQGVEASSQVWTWMDGPRGRRLEKPCWPPSLTEDAEPLRASGDYHQCEDSSRPPAPALGTV